MRAIGWIFFVVLVLYACGSGEKSESSKTYQENVKSGWEKKHITGEPMTEDEKEAADDFDEWLRERKANQ